MTAGLALVAGSTILIGGAANADPNEPILVTPADLSPDAESSANYDLWHQGYGDVDIADAAQITADGLVLDGKSQIIKGLAAAESETDLAALLATADVTSTDDAAFFQVAVDAVTGDDTSFATLRPELPGAANLTGDWESSKAIGSIAANTPTPIADFADQMPGFDLLAFGVLTETGSGDTVTSLSFDGEGYQFGLPQVPPVDPGIQVTPGEIKKADFIDPEKGFDVKGQGFAPGEELTLSLTLPTGEVVGFEDGENTITAGDDGTFELTHLVLTGDDVPLGLYVFTAVDPDSNEFTGTINVVADEAVVVPAADTPAQTAQLANTGFDTAPLYLTAAGGLLILGLGALGVSAARRRRDA